MFFKLQISRIDGDPALIMVIFSFNGEHIRVYTCSYNQSKVFRFFCIVELQSVHIYMIVLMRNQVTQVLNTIHIIHQAQNTKANCSLIKCVYMLEKAKLPLSMSVSPSGMISVRTFKKVHINVLFKKKCH